MLAHSDILSAMEAPIGPHPGAPPEILPVDTGHAEPPVPTGATIGILGGGQLGRMLGSAARALGYRVAVLDPDPDCPASGSPTRSSSAATTTPPPRSGWPSAARS